MEDGASCGTKNMIVKVECILLLSEISKLLHLLYDVTPHSLVIIGSGKSKYREIFKKDV